MKFLVGYQQRPSSEFINEIINQKNQIGEVYFSWGNFPNGRNSQLLQTGKTPWEAQSQQEQDIKSISEAGIPLNLLFNAMCYGKYSQSRIFFESVGETVDYIASRYNLTSVTTTSPLIAKFLKQNFEKLDIRASVNMGINSIESAEYIKDYFDSFYAARELNRNFKALKSFKKWCDYNGKKVYGLANSGCLNNCSAHTFHDNLVAHESEIVEMDNAYQFEGQCRIFLEDIENREKWFSVSSFIRPEDIHLYDDFFDGIKLATRVNKNPERVLKAYIKASFNGNLPELMEPDHSALFYPNFVDNKKIPKDFAVKRATCDKNCETCGYCKKVLSDSLICLE